jgi:tetratricopeptide (TPR) repeat protein
MAATLALAPIASASPSPPPVAAPQESPGADTGAEQVIRNARAMLEIGHYDPVQVGLTTLLRYVPDRVDVMLLLAEAFHRDVQHQPALELLARALALEPENVPALAARTRVLIALGQFDDARRSIAALTELEADHPWIAPLHGYLALADGSPERCLESTRASAPLPAAESFRASTRSVCLMLARPRDLGPYLQSESGLGARPVELLRRYGHALHAGEELDAALRTLPDELAGHPWTAQMRLASAELRGDRPGRRAALEALIAAQPGVVDWKVDLARADFDARRYQECVDQLQGWFANTAMPYPAVLLAGQALRALERCEEAIAFLEIYLKTDPWSALGGTALADCLALEDRHEQAESRYRKVLEAAPGHRPAVMGLASQMRKRGRLADARQLLESFQVAERRAEQSARSTRFLRLAASALGAERWDEAERSALQAIDLDPGLIDAHAVIAIVAVKRGDPAAARASFRRILEIEPDHPRVRIELATLARSEGDTDAAISLLEEHLDRHPGAVAAVVELATLYRETGAIEGVLPRARRALELRPGTAQLHALMAEALYSSGQHAQALEHALRAAEIDPGREGWQRALMLAELAGDDAASDRARAELARLGAR